MVKCRSGSLDINLTYVYRVIYLYILVDYQLCCGMDAASMHGFIFKS